MLWPHLARMKLERSGRLRFPTTAHLASQCPFLAVTPESGLGVTAASGINVDIMIKWRSSLHFFYSLYWQKNNVCFPNTIAHFYYQVSLLMVVQSYRHADNDLRLHLHFWNTFHLSSFCQELASVIQSFYCKIGLLFNLCYRSMPFVFLCMCTAFISITNPLSLDLKNYR